MSKQQYGLGKGLSALLPDPEPVPLNLEPSKSEGETAPQPEKEPAGVLRLPIEKVEPNPEQPRKTFSEKSIAELADSIKRHGVIQPLIVEKAENDQYRIVAGERRWRAANAAGLKEIPVIVQKFTPERRLEIMLIENIQREDLNPVEEAEAYKALMDLTACTQEEVADKVGKSRPAVANALRLLRLPAAALDALKEGRISAGHARALLAVQDPHSREILFNRLINEALSVRQAESAAQDLNRGAKNGTATIVDTGSRPKDMREPELIQFEQQLIGILGTKVAIRGDLKKGSIVIEYYSPDDLERIFEAVQPDGK